MALENIYDRKNANTPPSEKRSIAENFSKIREIHTQIQIFEYLTLVFMGFLFWIFWTFSNTAAGNL